MYRLHPLWQRVRALVDDGAVGELRAIQAFFSYRNVDPDNIRNIAAFGGGALMDIGCYPINVARWMFDGEPDDVVADGAPRPAVRHRRPDVGDARLRRPPRHVHVLDAGRGRPAGPPGRHGRSAARRDPVQHPARSADAHRPGGGRRPAGRTRPRGHRGAGGRSVRRAGRRVLDRGARGLGRSPSRRPTPSATWPSSNASSLQSDAPCRSACSDPVVPRVVLELDEAEVLEQRRHVHGEPPAVALAQPVPAADRVVG